MIHPNPLDRSDVCMSSDELDFHDNPVCGGSERVRKPSCEGVLGERRETVGLKSSGSSYTFKLTIMPFDHMIFLMSLALII